MTFVPGRTASYFFAKATMYGCIATLPDPMIVAAAADDGTTKTPVRTASSTSRLRCFIRFPAPFKAGSARRIPLPNEKPQMSIDFMERRQYSSAIDLVNRVTRQGALVHITSGRKGRR